MKSLFFLSIYLFSLTASANLIGSASKKNSKSNFSISIMDFQRPNSVSLNIFMNGMENARFRQLNKYLPVEMYDEIFHQEIPEGGYNYGSIGDAWDVTVFTARMENGNRVIYIKNTITDPDSREKVGQDFIDITFKGEKASIKFKAIRLVKHFFFFSKLKTVAENEVHNLNVKKDGVWLYGDNKGQPLGRVITYDGLLEAAKDTSTRALIEACEADCVENW